MRRPVCAGECNMIMVRLQQINKPQIAHHYMSSWRKASMTLVFCSVEGDAVVIVVES